MPTSKPIADNQKRSVMFIIIILLDGAVKISPPRSLGGSGRLQTALPSHPSTSSGSAISASHGIPAVTSGRIPIRR